jgi:transcriptional regulator GlxA family with amidase domain
MTPTRRPFVALLAAPETSPFVLYGLYEVLMSVGAVFPDMTSGLPGDALLDVRIVAASAEPFRCFGNVPVEPQAAIDEVERADVVIVCDRYTPIDTPPHGHYPREIEWLRQMHAGGALIATVCTGALLLAESGLLDGRSCAGHWAYQELFKAAYPRIRFGPASILDLASEPDGLITAGGVTAWQDLALHLIARLCGPEHASRTAKVYLLGGHEDGQLPFTAMVQRTVTGDALIRDCLAWIADNYALANPVTAMAEQSGLTSRTFARRFLAATGHRPIDYVQALRVERARALIESSGGRLDDVGFSVGYEDPTFFRRLFKRTTGLSPAAYRRKFAPIAGTHVASAVVDGPAEVRLQ